MTSMLEVPSVRAKIAVQNALLLPLFTLRMECCKAGKSLPKVRSDLMYVVGLAVLGLRRFLAAKCPHVIGRGGQCAA
jgi:hypothetical protein